jgi:hypothetical protein
MRNAAAQREVYDTSPRNGCCIATQVAIRELGANAAASESPLTVVAAQESEGPVWEPIDFVGRDAAPSTLLSNQN